MMIFIQLRNQFQYRLNELCQSLFLRESYDSVKTLAKGLWRQMETKGLEGKHRTSSRVCPAPVCLAPSDHGTLHEFYKLGNLNGKLCKMRKVLSVFDSKTSSTVRCTINLYTTKITQFNDLS